MNKPHDESIDVEDSEADASPQHQQDPGFLQDEIEIQEKGEFLVPQIEPDHMEHKQLGPTAPALDEDEERAAEESEGAGEESDDDNGLAPVEGSYDPNEFQHLPVSTEVKDLFRYIDSYKPQAVDIEYNLKPFILDYIPAIGDIDAFIKIPRPDDTEDNLGLVVLDEPCAKQSDPTVLDLHLRAVAKEGSVPKTLVAKELYRADKHPRDIDQWVESIKELHKSKPPTTVHYTRPMPDIDTLMQEWPAEFEELLKRLELPTAEMEVPLEQTVDMICAVLDIPIHKSRVQSLHVLFTLYSEFKNSQHFKALAEENQMDNNLKDQFPQGADRLEL